MVSLKVDTPDITSKTVDTYSEQHKCLQLPPHSESLEGQDRECSEHWCNRSSIDDNLCTSQNYPQGIFATVPSSDIYFSSAKSLNKGVKRKHFDFESILKDLSNLEHVSTDLTFRDSLDSESLSLHLKTIESDFNMCNSQLKFKDYYLSHQDVPIAIPVPYPPPVSSDNVRALIRCLCPHCCDNHCKLVSNYNILTRYKDAIKMNVELKTCADGSIQVLDKDHSIKQDRSLPLKKRKTLTQQLPKPAKQEIPSYPSTPMISIAELELTNFKPTSRVRDIS